MAETDETEQLESKKKRKKPAVKRRKKESSVEEKSPAQRQSKMTSFLPGWNDPNRDLFLTLRPLFMSPMNAMLTLNNMCGVPLIQARIDDKLIKMKGLTKLMTKCFFPGYRYGGTDSPTVAAARAAKEGQAFLPPDIRASALARKRKFKGTALGNEVDNQLRLYANNPEAFSKLGRRINKITDYLITGYQKWGFKVAISQFPIAAPDVRIGTRIDMLAVGPEGEAVLIENKTGFATYLYHPCGRMKPPLQDYNDCPLHQHWLQATLENMILLRYWKADCGPNCYAIIANPNGVQRSQVPVWMYERRGDIWKRFREFMIAENGRPPKSRKRKKPSGGGDDEEREKLASP